MVGFAVWILLLVTRLLMVAMWLKRVRLTRKTHGGVTPVSIPDQGHSTPRRWKRLRPLPPKEWGVRRASLAIFFLDLELGDVFALGTPGTCLRRERAQGFCPAGQSSRRGQCTGTDPFLISCTRACVWIDMHMKHSSAPQPPPPQPQPQPQPTPPQPPQPPQPPHSVAIWAQDVTGVPGWRSWVLYTRVSVLFSCVPSMPSLMRALNSSHVVGAVSDVHGVCGLLPSAGLVSSILLSSLFWSSASCAMFGKFKGPNPLCCVKTGPSGYGVCMLDTPPSVLTTCETDFLSYDTFECACISYGVLLAVIPI